MSFTRMFTIIEIQTGAAVLRGGHAWSWGIDLCHTQNTDPGDTRSVNREARAGYQYFQLLCVREKKFP